MPGSRKDSPLSALSALSLVGSLGLVVACAIVAGVFAGRYLDRLFNGGGLILAACILAGVFAGLLGAGRMLLREGRWKR